MRVHRDVVPGPLRHRPGQLRAPGELWWVRRQRLHQQHVWRLCSGAGRDDVRDEELRDDDEQLRSARRLREERRLRDTRCHLQSGRNVLRRRRCRLQRPLRDYRHEQLQRDGRLLDGVSERDGLLQHQLLHAGAARDHVRGRDLRAEDQQLWSDRRVPRHLPGTEHLQWRRCWGKRVWMYGDEQHLREPMQRHRHDELRRHGQLHPRLRLRLRL